MGDFSSEEKVYPNGQTYFELRVGKVAVGTAVAVENGFMAHGRRKPVATLQEAAKQCLDSRINKCMKEHERWRKLLQRL